MKNLKFFEKLPANDIANLYLNSEEIQINPNEIIYDESSDPGFFYYIEEGSVELTYKNKTTQLRSGFFFGEEAVLEYKHYLSKAVSQGKVKLIKFKLESISRIIKENIEFKNKFFNLLYNNVIDSKIDIIKKEKKTEVSLKSVFAFFSAILAFFFLLLPLSWEHRMFFTFLFSGVAIILFSIKNMIIVVLMFLIGIGSLQIVPTKVVFSGFSQLVFFIAFCYAGIGVILFETGFIFYVLSFIRKKISCLKIFFIGFFLSLLIPFVNKREQILNTLTNDDPYFKNLNYWSSRIFAPLFFNGSLYNFFIIGIIPYHSRYYYSWIAWLSSAIVCHVILFILVLPLVIFFNKKISFDKGIHFRHWLKDDVYTILSLGVIFWGILFKSHYQISDFFFLGVIFLLLFLFVTFNKEQVINKIDWPFLLLLGAFIGLLDSLFYLKIAYSLTFPFQITYFILCISVSIILIRCLFSIYSTILLGIIIYLLFLQNVMHPWLFGYLLLLFNFCLLDKSLIGIIKNKNNKKEMLFAVWIYFSANAAALISTFYWKEIGMIK
jgi:hypothetical protein